MTFLWKKVRLTKLPELVNDQLRKSQKRRDGSPLLIQTGFPASLIDLFFKNQDKLKKSPQKNRESYLSPIHVNHPCSPKPRNIHSPEKEMCVDANEVLFSVLKMFFVVVLALGMNRLTLGIAFSAFLLFSLDFLGKRVLSIFSKPCSENVSIKIIEPTKCNWASQVEKILPEMELMYNSKEGVEEKQVELKKKKSRKDKLKSKMTKFVSKKLKSCKKLEEIKKDEENESICGLSKLDNNKEAVMVNREEEGTSIGGLNWSHLVLLISIVLIGLIGGRGFAIVLTLWCCLMLNWMK